MLAFRAADAISAQLGDLPVSFKMITDYNWQPAIPARIASAKQLSSTTGANSVFWIDLYDSQQVFLFIASPAGDRILVRNITAQGGGIEGRLETLAVIVRGAVKAILAGGEIGVTIPSPPPPPPQPRSERFDASLSYIMQLYAPDKPLLHGARADFSVEISRWFRAYLGYRLQLPVKVETSQVAVDIRPHPLEMGLGARLGSDKWRLDLGLGLVIDFLSLEVVSLDPNVETQSPERPWMVSLAPVVGLGRTAGKVATFFIAVGLDVALEKPTYIIETGTQNVEVIAPWRLRPTFQLGARFTML